MEAIAKNVKRWNPPSVQLNEGDDSQSDTKPDYLVFETFNMKQVQFFKQTCNFAVLLESTQLVNTWFMCESNGTCFVRFSSDCQMNAVCLVVHFTIASLFLCL